MTTIEVAKIVVEDRQRIDLGDIPELAASLKEKGTILPIVLEARLDGSFRLIDGMRRLQAVKHNGSPLLYHGSVYEPEKPGFVFGKELPEDVLQELELEADIRRKDRTWQERCIAVAKIHALKRKKSVEESKTWGQRETAAITKDSLGTVNYCLVIAKKLEDKNSPYWKCNSLKEAWDQRMLEDNVAALAELAKRQQVETTNHIPIPHHEIQVVENAQTNSDLLAVEREKYYSNPLHAPESFDSYWSERVATFNTHKNTIYLTNRFILGDSIAYMKECGGMFDHIITDIPYGIETDNMDQNIGALKDIETVTKEHDVEYNIQLIQDFFPAAFHCTTDKAFVITWCDAWLFRFMGDCALAAGFRVQRWPYHWLKPTSANACASYNQTKATEIAIICRKAGATLVHQIPRNYGPVCTSEEAKKLTGHPYAKPFETTQELVDAVSIEGQKILDPFCGKGSMVLKMLEMKRQPFGCELNVDNYNELIENMKRYYLELNPNFIFK